MKILGTLLFIGLALSTPDALATQTSFRAVRCTGACTAATMLTQARSNPLGILFIYDLPHAVIRKYEVYMDSDCRPTGGPTASVGSGNQIDCGSFKVATEEPIDASVQQVMQALVSVNQVNPTLVATAKAEHRGTLPIDNHTGQPFDLVDTAWEYPNGTYDRFESYIQSNLGSEALANGLAPGLGTYLYSWQQRSRRLEIQVSAAPVQGEVVWDRSNSTTFDMCNVDNDCAEFKLTNPNMTGPVQIEFLGVKDATGHPYPQQSTGAPGVPNWIWHHPYAGGGSWHFANGLSQIGVVVGGTTDGCGQNADYYLSCAWRGNELIGCNLSCN